MRVQPASPGVAPFIHREVPQVPGFLDGRLAGLRSRGLALAAAAIDDRGHDRHELGRLHWRSIRSHHRPRNPANAPLRLTHERPAHRAVRPRRHPDRLGPAHPRQLPSHPGGARPAAADGRGLAPGRRHAAHRAARRVGTRPRDARRPDRDLSAVQPRQPRPHGDGLSRGRRRGRGHPRRRPSHRPGDQQEPQRCFARTGRGTAWSG